MTVCATSPDQSSFRLPSPSAWTISALPGGRSGQTWKRPVTPIMISPTCPPQPASALEFTNQPVPCRSAFRLSGESTMYPGVSG